MVGKSDFNENPVVSPVLDLDFGLRLRVCQFRSKLDRTSTTQGRPISSGTIKTAQSLIYRTRKSPLKEILGDLFSRQKETFFKGEGHQRLISTNK